MSPAPLPPLTLKEAYKMLSEMSGWAERDVERDSTYACELAGRRCIEARNVIRASKDAKKNGLL